MVVVQPNHEVIDPGPYRWLRHPSYTGILIALTGIGLVFADWVSIASLLTAALLAIALRIRVEERTLVDALGEDYTAYARRTSRLIPRIY